MLQTALTLMLLINTKQILVVAVSLPWLTLFHTMVAALILALYRLFSPHIPGWSDSIQPLKESSSFGHHFWIEAGRPRIGQVTCIMRSIRTQYQRAIKDTRPHEMCKESFANTVLPNLNRDFWCETRRMQKFTRCSSMHCC
jgi:hypothetical protein